jgi:glycosyltransferase involved in cell wall biosynthesis
MSRILFVIPTLDRAGAEKQLASLATRLPRSEFSVEVCAMTRGGPYGAPLEAAHIPVRVLDKRMKIDPVAAWRLGRLIGRERYDIVHTWLFSANCYGRAMAFRHKVPIVIASERCADHWKGPAELAMDRWLAGRTDAIVVNARAVARFYESCGLEPAKLVVIPNGIAWAPPPDVNRAEVLAEFDLPGNARVLGFVGRLWPQKRVRDLIWAVEVIRNIKPEVHALIVGDGPERLELVDFAEKVAIQEKIRFAGARDDVPRLLAVMDILVLPSEFEGMPNAIMEAMAAGLPVVASNIPGNDELVIEGQTGFLVPVGDTKALATRINQLLDDDVLRKSFGQAGQERVRTAFTMEQMVERHVALYRQLLSQKGKGAA